MKPFRFHVDRLIDFGTIVSMVGIDADTGDPVTVHVDHRPRAMSVCRSPSNMTPPDPQPRTG